MDTLATIAEASGLDKQEALNVINDKNAYANDVRIEEAIAQQYQISGVPYFIINQKYAISGAQPLETFVGALQQVWEEEESCTEVTELSVDGGSDLSCTDGSCSVRQKNNSFYDGIAPYR